MAKRIFRRFCDAVVRVHSEFSLTLEPYTNSLPLDYASYFLHGNGFFIAHNIILCPAHLVLIPPTIIATNNRFPYENNQVPAPSGILPNRLVKVSRILVDVFVFNDMFTYQATLMGVDGAGDIALLFIDPKLDFNVTNPEIPKCHPHLCLTNNQKYCNGSAVYLIGDLTASIFPLTKFGTYGITKGIISSNRFTDINGLVLPELILVNAHVPAQNTGLPIISKSGKVVGMQVTHTASLINRQTFDLANSFGDGATVGVTSCFMYPVINALLCKDKHTMIVPDALGPYKRYVKGYAGVYSSVLTGIDYDITYTPTEVLERFSPNGQFSNSPGFKGNRGVIVLALAGVDSEPYFVPGANAVPPFPPLVNSVLDVPLYSIVVELDDKVLGTLGNQRSPSSITWTKSSGEKVKVIYRSSANNYEAFYKTEITLEEYPPLMDFPWFKIGDYPIVNVPAPSVPVTVFAAW